MQVTRSLPQTQNDSEPLYQLRTALYALIQLGEVECSSEANAQELRALYRDIFPEQVGIPGLLTANCDGVITVQVCVDALPDWSHQKWADTINAHSNALYARGEILLGQCQWFARCTTPAVQLVQHPVLGGVPCCERHVKFATGN